MALLSLGTRRLEERRVAQLSYAVARVSVLPNGRPLHKVTWIFGGDIHHIEYLGFYASYW